MLEWLLGKRSARPRAPSPRAHDPQDPQDALFDEGFQQRLEYLAIVARRVYAGRARAERRSKKVGSGIEFADYREYVPGDDLRYLDWNVYQRLGRLLVRLHEEEEDLCVYVLLDTSASMGFGNPTKLVYGKRLTAALAYIALANLDRVGVVAFRENLAARLPSTRGKARIFTLFDFLRGLEPKGETSFAQSLRAFVAQNKRRGVVVVVSDLYDPMASALEEGLNALRYARFEPYVIHLVSDEDVRPALYGDVEIMDAETGRTREVTVTPALLARYAQAHLDYRRRVAELCRSKQVPYFDIDTAVAFEESVLGLLRRGGMVGS